jgi:integrase
MKALVTKRRKPEVVKVGNIAVKIYRRDKRHKLKDKEGKPTGEVVEYRVYEVEDFTTGRRRLHSFSDHEKAEKKANKIAEQLNTGKTVAAAMTDAQAASYGRGVELIRPTGATLETVCDTYARCYKEVGDRMLEACRFFKLHNADSLKPCTVRKAIDELVENRKKRGKSARYTGDLKARLDRFAESFAVEISTVTTADVQGWIDELEVAPQTAKNFRTVIGTLFAYAEARGYIIKGGNPINGVEAITANGGSIEIYTPEEITKLLKAASPDFLPFIALGAFAGLRSAEIERLEWKDIDRAGGFITVAADKAKTRARRLVPLTPNLAQWLAKYASNEGKVWKATTNDLQDARAATVTAAGIPWKDNGARHSFISYRLAALQDVNKVALEAGNSPAVIFKHYRELVKPDAAQTWFAIVPEVKK